jgi:hypothetical protein
VPLGRNHARPSRTARVWPAARVRGPARPAHTTRGARRERAALPGGTRLGGGAARRDDTGAREAAEEQRLTGAVSTSEAPVGTAVRSARRSGGGRGRQGDGRGDGGGGEAGAVGDGGGTESGAAVDRARRGRGSCRDARHAVPTAALSRGIARHVAATRQRRLTGGARCQRFPNKQIPQKKIAQNK